jgi:hypothetical protein
MRSSRMVGPAVGSVLVSHRGRRSLQRRLQLPWEDRVYHTRRELFYTLVCPGYDRYRADCPVCAASISTATRGLTNR